MGTAPGDAPVGAGLPPLLELSFSPPRSVSEPEAQILTSRVAVVGAGPAIIHKEDG